ncbi:MAG TPA: hypothetical protein VN958_07315, partial [Chitinophagaceae bacterium]|nr:hypothetical protein [Chitinophagaceae bacterium]
NLDGKKYSETVFGNMELQFVIDYAKFVSREFRVAFWEEFEKYNEDIKSGKYNFPWLNLKNPESLATEET